MSVNPFIEAADALAAHGRQERGRVVRLLADDPETPEETAAEKQRQRVLRWNAKQAEAAREQGISVREHFRRLAMKQKRGAGGRFVKEGA